MGISGLLPALKKIQVTKHLSEFRGQTVAVDAYVWLHKAVYSCATELATGKPTHKYVDYAMHRVRLLRHYKIEPYVVFDGGPLPAKKGTESDRKRKREENLARGKLLTSQGRHTEARECYVKCVDVTPQMAYQFIKALKTEGVSYVVAPFEADAQLAYLERIGLVDAILTEDSDLLVYGCRNVLFKLDTVENTVVCISRGDFAKVADAGGISLVGWSDIQFRTMAILSGCDYLPSIPGVGLKTACQLLKKWKTVDQVVRALALEGKKNVPPDYLKNFNLADKCFQHQRVYCPLEQKLAYLVQPDDEWTSEEEAYVGGSLDDKVATGIAVGDIDPITLCPMVDTNSNYQPRVLKPLPGLVNLTRTQDKGKGKAPDRSGGIFDFFGPNAKIPCVKRGDGLSPSVKPSMSVGKTSGKRTLSDAMDHSRQSKQGQKVGSFIQSKFFTPCKTPTPQAQDSKSRPSTEPGPSRLKENKENVCIVIDDDDVEEAETSTKMRAMDCGASMVAQRNDEIEIEEEWEFSKVDQEDGYISLGASDEENEAEVLSSPVRGRTPKRRRAGTPNRVDEEEETDASVELISSPYTMKQSRATRTVRSRSLSPRSKGRTSGPPVAERLSSSQGSNQVVDLRHCFADNLHNTMEMEASQQTVWSSDTPSSHSPSTPATPANASQLSVVFDIDLEGPEEIEDQNSTVRQLAVANGWREKWAHARTPSVLRRRETNVTPAGRHNVLHTLPRTSGGAPLRPVGGPLSAKGGRKSLVFLESAKTSSSKAGTRRSL